VNSRPTSGVARHFEGRSGAAKKTRHGIDFQPYSQASQENCQHVPRARGTGLAMEDGLEFTPLSNWHYLTYLAINT